MRVKFLFALALIQNIAFADFMPFNHDIYCKSKNDFSSVKVVYNKKEYPNYGWQGGIHWEINVGFNTHLANMLAVDGWGDGKNVQLIKESPAGVITNWIEQDEKDPIIMQSVANNGFFVIKKDGAEIGKYYDFLATLRISKVKERGYDYLSKQMSDQEYYLVQLNSANAKIRYELDECKLLN